MILSNEEIVKQILDTADKINNISRTPVGNYLILSPEILEKLNEQEILKLRNKKIRKIINEINNKRNKSFK